MDKNINILFDPKIIAVIGASSEPGSVGYGLFKNLIKSKFKGKIYPVNIKRKKVQGQTAYPTIADVPAKVDLAMIAVPAKAVPAVVAECGKAGVKGAVIISAGFKEIGEEGAKLQAEIGTIAKQYGVRVIGPNCLGFIRTENELNASFAREMALPGCIALISQSGALGTGILDWSIKNGIGFSYFISIGDMVDLDFTDLVEHLENDKQTKGIFIYMESLARAKEFLAAVRRVGAKKPIVIIKTGRSLEGANAAKSHTGSLAGNDVVFSAAFAKAGVTRVDTIEDFFNLAKGLSMQPQPQGKNLAIVTNAGGVGVVSADSLIFSGGNLAKLDEATLASLNKVLPSAWSHHNPVDILGDAPPERYQQAVELCLQDKNVDGVLAILTPQIMTEPTTAAKELVKAAGKNKKTVYASWVGGAAVKAGIEILQKNDIPNFQTPESAIRCFLLAQKPKHSAAVITPVPDWQPDKAANEQIIKTVRDNSKTELNELEANQFMANYGLPTTKGKIASNAAEAGVMSSQIGFPVVMKILAPEIIHKIDVGGVVLNIQSVDEAISAYNQMMITVKKNVPSATIRGVYLEAQVKKRYELLLGYKKDDIFGPVIAFGTGGTAVEVYKDTKLALPPLSLNEIASLVKHTKVFKLLKGYRNLPAVNLDDLYFLIYKFSHLVCDFQGQVKEIDINPLAIDEQGAIILDAKVILE